MPAISQRATDALESLIRSQWRTVLASESAGMNIPAKDFADLSNIDFDKQLFRNAFGDDVLKSGVVRLPFVFLDATGAQDDGDGYGFTFNGGVNVVLSFRWTTKQAFLLNKPTTAASSIQDLIEATVLAILYQWPEGQCVTYNRRITWQRGELLKEADGYGATETFNITLNVSV